MTKKTSSKRKGIKMYKRISEGFKKQYMIPMENNIYEFLKDKDKSIDWYESPILYTEEQYKKFKKTNKVAGIRDTITKKLWWDFDCKGNLDSAKQSTEKLVERLLRKGFKQESIQVKFSGGKGFHVVIDTDHIMSYKQAKRICKDIAEDLQGFDDSVYLPTQLLRAPLTKHKSTGLYAVPIAVDELPELSIDEIKDMAQDGDSVDIDAVKDYYKESGIDGIIDIPEVEEEVVSEKFESDLSMDILRLNFANKPNFLDNARYALQQGYFKEGERNKALLCLAATYKNAGFEIEHTYRLLKGVAELSAKRNNSDRYPDDEIWNNIMMTVYGPDWRGGQFSVKDPESWLYKYANDYKIPNDVELEDHDRFVMNIANSLSGFQEYAKNIKENTMQFGIPELDNKLRVQVGHLIGILAGPGIGKCLAKDTPVMLHTGDIIPVQQVKRGDLLMGDDSTPRKVLSTCQGRETMYRIKPVKGSSYVVNESHILSLKYTSERSRGGFKKGQIVNLSIKEYFDLPKATRTRLKGYRVPIDFPAKPLDFDPYLIGLWLGDGTRTKPEITTTDQEIKDYIKNYSLNNNYKLTAYEKEKAPRYNLVTERGQVNPFWNEVQTCLYNGEKRIPLKYLRNSRKNRMRLLAGLIDSDGHLLNKCYEYTTKDSRLKEDVLYLCRSLGYAAYCSDKIIDGSLYFRITISGNLNEVPVLLPRKKCEERLQVKDVLVTGIDVEKLDEDDYYGFEIDGNKLFVLGDFTVTHNTSLAVTLLNNTSKMGTRSFFGSYDMAGNILIQKLIQRELRITPDELYEIYEEGDEKRISQIQAALNKNYNHVSFCFRAGQSISSLRRALEKEEEILGEKIKLVVIDYLELIQTKTSDPTGASAEAIQGLREIANEGRVVVCLLQPNKLSSKPDEPLLTYNAAKGSSAIAQAVTAMITCHRPGYNPNDPSEDKYFGINIVKNRMGELGKIDFGWEGLTGRITQLEDIQKMDLKELRDRKKAEKDDDDFL